MFTVQLCFIFGFIEDEICTQNLCICFMFIQTHIADEHTYYLLCQI